MEQKELIYFDEKMAIDETEGHKRLNQALIELKNAFDLLRLGMDFSQKLCLELVDAGPYALINSVRLAFTAQFENVKVPTVFNEIASLVDLTVILRPIEVPLSKVKLVLQQTGINLSEARFEGPEPVFTDSDKDAIREKHRYWAQTKEEVMLFQKLSNLCNIINSLDEWLKKGGNPGLFDNTLYELSEIYITWREIPGDRERYTLVPYEGVFKTLETIKKRRK